MSTWHYAYELMSGHVVRSFGDCTNSVSVYLLRPDRRSSVISYLCLIVNNTYFADTIEYLVVGRYTRAIAPPCQGSAGTPHDT